MIERTTAHVLRRFGGDAAARAKALAEADEIQREIVAAFGREVARALVATLGPDKPVEPVAVVPAGICRCDCSDESDYCWSSPCRWGSCGCRQTEQGCGFLYSYACTGWCSDCESYCT